MTVYLVDEPSSELAASYASKDAGAHVFFLMDAVYSALRRETAGEAYVLKEDLARRGLTSKVPPGVHVVGFGDLVAMMEEEKVVNFL